MPHFFRFSRLLGTAALSAGLSLTALAQTTTTTDRTPKYANEFLNIGVGGRALGMGNTQVSLGQDATAGYWNPAGLVGQKTKYDAVLMHSELFSGIVKNDYAAFSMPLDERSAIGASLIRLGVDDIADTRALVNEYGQIDYSRITYFSVADYAMLLSYARKVGPEGLTLGGSGKIVYRNVGSFATAWGFGFDAGAQYQRGNLRLGLMARDITTTVTAWSINADKFRSSTNDTLSIPKSSSEITLPRFVLGGSYQVKLPGQFSAIVATDLEMTTDGKRNTPVSTSFVSIDPKLGLEIGYHQVAFLRAGVSNFQKTEGTTSSKEAWRAQPSLGVGFTASGLRLDVALSRLAVEQAKTNSIIVSLGYGFQ